MYQDSCEKLKVKESNKNSFTYDVIAVCCIQVDVTFGTNALHKPKQVGRIFVIRGLHNCQLPRYQNNENYLLQKICILYLQTVCFFLSRYTLDNFKEKNLTSRDIWHSKQSFSGFLTSEYHP